jgi:glucose/arabinose dehydrogenase
MGLALCLLLLGRFGGSAALVHAWHFNETTGTNLFDSVGNAHGWVVALSGGGGYSLDGKRIRLDGGARSNADYVLFPENTFDGLSNVTVEVWAIPHSFPNYGRVFEIGPGEGQDTTSKLIRASFSTGTNGELQYYGLWPTSLNAAQPTPVDREYHYVMTWSAAGELSFYRDGVLVGVQNTAPTNIANLAALPNTTFWLGRSTFTADSTANASWNELRIYDTVLDAATILNDYRRGVDDTFGLLHRWTFSETSGTNIADSVATARGLVIQQAAADFSWSAGRLTLAGGTRGSADYVSFPSRRLDGLTSMTLEFWAQPNSAQNWGRVFDIGDGVTPANSFLLSFTRGTDINLQRLEFKPSGTVDSSLPTTLGAQYQYVVTWDAAAGQCSWYRNGAFVTSFPTGSQTLANVTNTVFWLARSHYTADATAGASYDDVRVYNRALLADEIAFRYQQGPNSIAIPPAFTTNDSAIMNPGGAVLLDVVANDTPNRFDPNSLLVLSPPSFGTASAKPSGRVFYTNSSPGALSDSFNYRFTDVISGNFATGAVFITFTNALRIAATTLRMPDSPPLVGYQVINAFPGLTFEDALALAIPAGRTNQLFVVERRGIISYVPDLSAASPTRQVFLNVTNQMSFDDTVQGERGLLGLAFHPGFATNGYFFVFYVAPGAPYIDRLARFTADPVALTVNTNTQQILFDVVDSQFNHNGGDLHFGNDGYLYIGMGDEGGQYNASQNAQRIDKDLYSSLLRIDVDKRPGNPEPRPSANTTTIPTNVLGQAFYSIPADNPFVNATSFLGSPINTNALRAEIFAVGFRHIWRFSIDAPTGDIWVGEVGQDTYEEVNIVTNGGNYGWAYYEALTPAISLYPNQPTLLSNPPPSFVNTPPLWYYTHTAIPGGDPQYKGNSISGGVVYHGNRIPELNGAYIFGDFESANIWALRRTNNTVTVQRIAGQLGAAAFGLDPVNGDVLIANYVFNQVQRLVKTDTSASTFPQKLSDTGAFADLPSLTPNPGLVNYDPIIPFWSDYAIKRRWFGLPDLASRLTQAVNTNWTFPNGMVWVKHFDLELTRGDPATKHRLETRFIVKNPVGVYGVSYAWNAAGDEAFLVPDGGTNFSLAVTEGLTTVTQVWSVPSRAECLACHTPVAGHALSFNTRELNQAATMNGFAGNQLSTLSDAGYFDQPVTAPQTLPAFATATNAACSLEYRVRSYLAINCVQCHQPGGAGPGTWDARPWLTLDQTGLINGTLYNDGANPTNKLVIPGDLAHSVLLQRIRGNGFSRMPPLATALIDQQATNLLTAWISTELTNHQSFAQWQVTWFGSTNNPSADPNADPDGDGANNYYEFLTQTSPISNSPPWTITFDADASSAAVSFLRIANMGFLVYTSTNFTDWTVWDVPANRLWYSASNFIDTISGPVTAGEANRFFRVQIIPP